MGGRYGGGMLGGSSGEVWGEVGEVRGRYEGGAGEGRGGMGEVGGGVRGRDGQGLQQQKGEGRVARKLAVALQDTVVEEEGRDEQRKQQANLCDPEAAVRARAELGRAAGE